MECSKRKNEASSVNVTTSEEADEVLKALDKEECRSKKEVRRKELMNTRSYYLMDKIQTIFDKYLLDPIIGFFFPDMGDITTGVLGLPYLYFAIVHAKSIPLTLAVIYNILFDCLVSLIPWLGDIFDIFQRAYQKNMRLVVGFINDDKKVMDEVRRKAAVTAVLIVVLIVLNCLLIWLIISLAGHMVSLFDWIISLF